MKSISCCGLLSFLCSTICNSFVLIKRRGDMPHRVEKVCVLGNCDVGKTCITLRFVEDRFSEDFDNTIGAAFKSRFFTSQQGTTFKFQIWDTAGQERYSSFACDVSLLFWVNCRNNGLRGKNVSILLIVYCFRLGDCLNRDHQFPGDLI